LNMATTFWRWLRPGLGLILALSFNSAAASAQTELSPPQNAPFEDSAATARVIVKFKQDTALPRKHALSATAGASQTRDALTARANALGVRLGMRLRAGRALDAHTQVVSTGGISGTALAARLGAEADVEYAVVDQRRAHFALPNDPLFAQGPPINGSKGADASRFCKTAEVTSSINASGPGR
jgi:serine protease